MAVDYVDALTNQPINRHDIRQVAAHAGWYILITLASFKADWFMEKTSS